MVSLGAAHAWPVESSQCQCQGRLNHDGEAPRGSFSDWVNHPVGTCITGIAMHRMGATALVHNKKLDYAARSFTVTCAASTPSASMGFFLVVRPRVVVYLLCLLLCLD